MVGLLRVIGQTIDVWPNAPLKVDDRSMHIDVLARMAPAIQRR